MIHDRPRPHGGAFRKGAKMGKFQGEGWYTFWPYRGGDPLWAGEPEAVWVDSEAEFEDFSEVPEGCELEVAFLGADDLPEGGHRVAERFVAAFTPEQAAAYEETMR